MLSSVIALAAGQPAPKTAAGDWPWWRGPSQDGVSSDRNAPTRWGGAQNVMWKVPVPGRGHSSPVIYGERVFLTTADAKTQKQQILAFDRATGRPLWTTLANAGGFMPLNPKNSHASATPACDGKRLYCAFIHHGGLHVTATDLDGKILWQGKAGGFTSEHGYGSSPVLHGSLVIVNGDSLKDCYVAALDAGTGKVVWKTPRKATGRHGSYATPVVARLAGRPQLLLTGMGETSAYDPDTGKLLWSCAGPAEVTGCTPAFSERLVFATGGFPEKAILAIRADGAGDVTKTHIVWRSARGVAYVPSPLYHADHLYLVSDGGVASCFEAGTGKQIWQGRLDGAFTSSPVLVGDLLYATNEAGKTFLFKAGPKFELAGTNDVGESVLASPAVCGGRFFLRTQRHLYCIGRGAKATRP